MRITAAKIVFIFLHLTRHSGAEMDNGVFRNLDWGGGQNGKSCDAIVW